MNGELTQRVERFTALQAAQRALAHSTHPSELAPVRTKSRELLIQLQSFAQRPPSDVSDADARGGLFEQIDHELDDQTERTLKILRNMQLAQLKATIPQLTLQYPDEVRGLTDVLLTGDLDDNKNLRTLEYLITNLSTEEKCGRRVVVVEPAKVTSRLQRMADDRSAAAEEKNTDAERYLSEATARALLDDELGEIRDQVREFKKNLGSDLLHPRTLGAAIEYNVAMWNRVALEIDSSRSIDELLEDLVEPASEADLAAAPAALETDALREEAFARLVSAFGFALSGESSTDESAMRVVNLIVQRSLRQEEREVFEGTRRDEATRLTRSAVVLGLILQHRSKLEDPLRDLGLDAEVLATECVDELMERMSTLARECFAASNYGDAFRLSDVKTHSLAPHAVSRRATGAVETTPLHGVEAIRVASAERPGALTRLAHHNLRLPSGLWAVVLMVLAMVAVPSLLDDGRQTTRQDRAELAHVSPFLERGRQFEGNDEIYFVGELNQTWDFVATDERRREAIAIGSYFDTHGTDHVTLLDYNRVVVAQYEKSQLILLVPRPPREPDD